MTGVPRVQLTPRIFACCWRANLCDVATLLLQVIRNFTYGCEEARKHLILPQTQNVPYGLVLRLPGFKPSLFFAV